MYPIVLNLIQSLLDIIEDVFYIFDTYREANQIWRNTCFLQLLFAELAMGVTGWMEHTGAGNACGRSDATASATM